jgi:hypothetical protein
VTLAAPARVVVVPVAAGAALRPLLTGPTREGTLLGAGDRAAWARFDDEVVVLAPPGGGRMPNGVEGPPALLGGLAAGEPCSVGGGVLAVGEWSLQAVRWWDSRPALPATDPVPLRRRAASLGDRFAPVADEGLGAALMARDPAAALTAAQQLIGKGPGLTPLGDDVLAGALASALLLGRATGHRRLCRMVARLAPALCAAARERTTALSATLLHHACRGEVDEASAALLQALCGRGDPAAALESLLALGHTSGRGLATGLLAGAAAAGGAS